MEKYPKEQISEKSGNFRLIAELLNFVGCEVVKFVNTMFKTKIVTILLFIAFGLSGQTIDAEIKALEKQIEQLSLQQEVLREKVETAKLSRIHQDLEAVGLPSENYIRHSALFLEYAEAYEQAKWVAHILTPDVIKGTAHRSNDFREDPLVKTGTAVEADYFLKYLQKDSTFKYDGFGFDRGHLAPSADFRWSKKALSESYFYSNMSPQRPEFNRESWAELEGTIRGYMQDHPTTQLYIVTGPVLKEGLPTIERSINKVAIPEMYFKVVLDLKAGKAIGFLMPNQKITYPLISFAKTIDEVEALTGLNFFNKIANEAEIESTLDKAHWLPDVVKGDVEPIYPPSLPAGHFNTVQAKQHAKANKEITVCGTVVSTRYSRSGNLWFNLDKKFPNQIFSFYISKKDLSNFSGNPEAEFEGKVVTVKGKVRPADEAVIMQLVR